MPGLGDALTTSHAIDLGAGSDKLTLGNFANEGSVTNVETLTGGTGDDTVTFTSTVSLSQSVKIWRTARRFPEVSPLVHSVLRVRLKKVT